NGFEDQAAFDKDRKKFEEVEEISDGLGPVYNATSCVSCHQNPVSGSSSQVAELRAGQHKPHPKDPKKVIFVEPPGGSLIHQRAIDAAIQEHVRPEDNVRTLRMSTNILGNGFVEVIPDEDIKKVRRGQPAGLKGLAVAVPVAVRGKKGADGESQFEFVERIGRFGWKCQEASLLNFSAGAYLNEMGITSPLQPKENTSSGRDVSQFDQVLDPEDEVDPEDPDNKEHPFGGDVKAFVRFMRSTKAPPRDFSLAGTDDVKAGERIFKDETTQKGKKLGCAICHHPDYTTPKAGTPIKPLHPGSKPKPGSDLGTVPKALGNKIIHPYSDFMLHDIGTGDGIAQTQHAQRPPYGVEYLEKLADDAATREGVVRVEARPEKGNRRALSDVPGLDQRTINMIRTAPLRGLRVRPQLLHDGSALTLEEAIRKHKVKSKAGDVDLPANYENLTDEQKKQLKAFLNSL
ncbi:MAG TPA: di-heme oxidoredictase family protein, partial [Gemmataceae bacterium]|nr:di-heme oxidoredictase family protein [Gemmataceae bacterium]